MSDKSIIETAFNGSPCDAMGYYIGKTFNSGAVQDKLVYCHGIEIDGITYNPSTHRYLSTRAHEKNLAIIQARIAAREEIKTPRVGDFLLHNGQYLRFTHEWPETMQTTCVSHGDATDHCGFYICKSGGTSYSGSLDSGVDHCNIIPTDEKRAGLFWCFNEDSASAHNGIKFYMPCRVYKVNPLDMPRKHHIRKVYNDGHTLTRDVHGTTASVMRELLGARQWEGGKWRIVEKVQFFDGEIWQTHKDQCRVLYQSQAGHVVDFGHVKGLLVHNAIVCGDKWFLDARRLQLIEHGAASRGFWGNFIKKEFE